MNRHSVALPIAADHPALAGHFPGFPVIPGVVLLDEALHAIGSVLPAHDPNAPWQIATVKFHRVALPGESLQLEVSWQSDGVAHFRMQAGSALIASGSINRHAKLRTVVG